jgi:hypothetical protein
MEHLWSQSGRNQWQPAANARASKTAQTSRSATVGNPQQRFRGAPNCCLRSPAGAALRPTRLIADAAMPTLCLAGASELIRSRRSPAVCKDALAGDPSGLVTGDHDNRSDVGGLGQAVNHLTPDAVVDDRFRHPLCHGWFVSEATTALMVMPSSPSVDRKGPPLAARPLVVPARSFVVPTRMSISVEHVVRKRRCGAPSRREHLRER